MDNILITGVGGNVGQSVYKYLSRHNQKLYLGVRSLSEYEKKYKPSSLRRLDFEDISTYDKALHGISRVFLVRPPNLIDVDGIFKPFISACKLAGVTHIVFLSLIGIEKNLATPHHWIEKAIISSKIPYTFIRPSFFMQNLIEPHGDDIRKYNQLIIPAGKSKTNFIDADDIGEIIAHVMLDEQHLYKKYDITGCEAITYSQVAQIMSHILNRPIVYTKPSLIKFYRHMRRSGHPKMKVIVMVLLYLSTRLGMAKAYAPDAEMLLGRKAHSMAEFIEANQNIWKKA